MACALSPTAQGTCCAGKCVDTGSDPANCGACGALCSGVCVYGCLQQQPQTTCLESCAPGAACDGEECVGSVCLPDGYGDCLAEDGTIGACCGPACANLLTDPLNCGQCGAACPTGQTCAAGTCSGSPACTPARVGDFCNLDAGLNDLCCPGVGCIDTSADSANCGACGNACPAGTTCQAGACE